MGSSKKQLEKAGARKDYANKWHTDLMRSPQSDPLFCCFALWCGPCASYWLRRRALYNDMSRYTCCGGYMPCSGRCGEHKCPEFCLCIEVSLCFTNSVASTRFMLQDEFNIQTTKCDNCIIGFMFCLEQLACIFSLIALIVGSEEIKEASQLLNCISDLVYYTVCPCMQTQHKAEMDKRDGKFGTRKMMAIPPVQQMSRIDQPLPPQAGYPPILPYGQASGYPSPPPGYGSSHGYPPPPPGYGPPHGYPRPPPAYGPPPSYEPPQKEYGQTPSYSPLPQPQSPEKHRPLQPQSLTNYAPPKPEPLANYYPPPQPQSPTNHPPTEPQSSLHPPPTYPPPGHGYSPINYTAHPPPDNNR